VFLLSLSPARPQPKVVTNTASGALVGRQLVRLKMTSTREGWVGGGVAVGSGCEWKRREPRSRSSQPGWRAPAASGLQDDVQHPWTAAPTPEGVRLPVPERDGWLVWSRYLGTFLRSPGREVRLNSSSPRCLSSLSREFWLKRIDREPTKRPNLNFGPRPRVENKAGQGP